MIDSEIYEAKARLLKALSHPLRLAICEYLLNIEKPKCVNKIASLFNQNQSVISKHLTILQQASIVKVRREGNFTRYTISDPKLVKKLIDNINALVKEYLTQKAKIIEHL